MANFSLKCQTRISELIFLNFGREIASQKIPNIFAKVEDVPANVIRLVSLPCAPHELGGGDVWLIGLGEIRAFFTHFEMARPW